MRRKMGKAVSLIAVMLAIVLLTACGGGSGSEDSSKASGSNEYLGTWYVISDPGESNPMNYVFLEDGTVQNDGVEGTYTVEDGMVTVNFLGTTETYYHTEYLGYDALFYEDEGVPFAAKSLEGAEQICAEFELPEPEDAEDVESETSEPLTEEEAFEQQGYFIMVGEDQFKPLGSDIYKWWDPIFLNLGAYVGEEELPTVSKSKEKIVYMSSSDSLSNGAYMPERKLVQEGYTIPAYVQSTSPTNVDDTVASFRDQDIISINGESLEEFQKENGMKAGTSWTPDDIYFDCEKDEDVKIKYRSGTAKEEYEAFAMTTYWLFEEGPEFVDETNKVYAIDGEGSYMELDLSDLKPGYYELDDTIIKLEK